MPFDQNVRTKVLLWCDRHCCLCKKVCGVNIEVHHLVPENEEGSDDIDNAIPLCFDCHSEVLRYNANHPKGTKYKPDELKPRRDQIYEEFTRHLVPPLDYHITQELPGGAQRKFPDVGFVITHLGDSLPVRVRVKAEVVLHDRTVIFDNGGHYSGSKLWHMNPRHSFGGHFTFPQELVSDKDRTALRITVSIIDQYERQHSLLPVGWVYMPDQNAWYAEP
jgi:hypothetical protein